MDGIEILSQTEIMQNSDFASTIITVGVVFVMFGVLVAMLGDIFNHSKVILFGVIFAILSAAVAFFISDTAPKEPSGRYEYQVTIGDDVSFTDFYQKYEIIDQDGKIYTIRDKKND